MENVQLKSWTSKSIFMGKLLQKIWRHRSSFLSLYNALAQISLSQSADETSENKPDLQREKLLKTFLLSSKYKYVFEKAGWNAFDTIQIIEA